MLPHYFELNEKRTFVLKSVVYETSFLLLVCGRQDNVSWIVEKVLCDGLTNLF